MKTYRRDIFDSFKTEVEDAVDRGREFVPRPQGLLATFFKFLPIVKPYWDKLLLVFVTLGFMSLARLISPWLGKFLIDDAIPNRDWTLFWIIVAGRIGMFGLIWIFRMLFLTFTAYVDLWVYSDLKSRFFDHLIRLSMTFMQNRPAGEHVYRASNDIGSVMFMITDLLPRFATSVFEFVLVMLFLSYLDFKVMLVVLLYMIPYTAFVHWLTTLTRKYDKEARGRWQKCEAVLQDGVAGKMVVKTFARRRFEVNKFMRANINGWRSQMKKHYLWIVRVEFVLRFMPWLMNWGLRGWFFREAILGHITYGALLPIFNYTNRFRYPLQAIINHFQALRLAMVPAERITQTLDVAPVVTNRPDAFEMPALKGAVEFRDVHFRYEEGVPILKRLNFRVAPGQNAAFVGHSGAGKSTILNLLLRLYDPVQGSVLVDGIDIRRVRMESLQQKVGLVFQETYLFVGTIRENLLFSDSQATDEEIWQALRIADLEDFVRSLPGGLDTDLHEGTSLSGGQKQRLGIARALVRDPRILILDEPTSSLDSDTEHRVLQTLRGAMDGRTTFIISHRMPTVIDADIIFVMDDGRIVESGSHTKLMAARGHYCELYTLFFSGRSNNEDDPGSDG